MRRFIAERKLIVKNITTGEVLNVTYRVGEPQHLSGEEFASCPVEWEGLFENVAPSKGIDMLHALQLAVDLDLMMKALANKYIFYWESGEPCL